MGRFGLTGGFYTLANITADAQQALNLFPEVDESQEGKSALTMLGTPGLKAFFKDPNQTATRAEAITNGRMFAIIGSIFYELLANGTATQRGVVPNDGQLASIAVGPSMLLIASGGGAYYFALIDVNSSVNQQVGTGILPTTQLKLGSVLAFTDGTNPFLYKTVAGDTLTTVAAQISATPYFSATVGTITVNGNPINNALIITALSGNDITISTNTLTDQATGLQKEAFQSIPVIIPANTFAPIPASTFTDQNGNNVPVIKVGFSDGFFIALTGGTNTFYVSNPEDASNWNQNGSSTISVIADNATAMFVDHRQIWFAGPNQMQPYYNTGALFPYSPVPGAFIEQGIGAPDSFAQLDNSLFWLGSSERGPNIVFRANGYTPERISTHAIEQELDSYPTTTDARGWSYVEQGHSFYVLYFPSANKTWVYDVATSLWHERDRWISATGQSVAFPGQVHVYAFGMHLIGDWSSGTIYSMSLAYLTDDGNPIRRVRRAPYISTEQQYIQYYQVQVDMEVGVGPIPPLTDLNGNPRSPKIILNWSNDGAKTWSNELERDIGMAGDYLKRVIWRRLGNARSRVFQITISDPVVVRITDGYLFASGGFSPAERISKSYLKVT